MLVFFSVTYVWAKDLTPVGPFPQRFQNPLYLLFLNLRPMRATILPRGDWRLEWTNAYSNLFERAVNENTGTDLTLDMELWRTAFVFAYGFRDDLEFGGELPFLHFGGGFLDGFVQGFHKAFGFPNGGRDTTTNGVYNVNVQVGGVSLFRPGSQGFGWGDLELYAKREFRKETTYAPAVSGSFHLKLPTGIRAEALGSGAPDFGFVTALEKSLNRFHLFANLGYFVLGGHRELTTLINPVDLTWMTALEINLYGPYWTFVTQLMGDTSLFSGASVRTLDRGALDWATGFAGRVDDWSWHIAFVEDPATTDPSVDFTIFLNLAYQWSQLKK